MRVHDVEIERVTTRYGTYHVVSRDSTIGRSLKLYGEWAENEIDSYSAFLENGETILDVGANIGTHSIALGWRFPDSEIHAFEPQPLAFSLLVANVLGTRRERVFPYNLGCGDREQVIRATPDYAACDWNIGALSLSPDSGSPVGFPTRLIALDELSFRHRVQFIKVDVEGMEHAVLAGAQKLIEADRPIIFFEVLDLERLAAARATLDRFEYELRWLQTDAFNSRNFRMYAENIWSYVETGVLALPTPNDTRARHLPLVSGFETHVPQRRSGSSAA